MTSKKNFKYYVVELIKSPIMRNYKYVCIPSFWKKISETTDGKVIIKYPIETISLINRRVRKGEEPLDDWPIHSAEIKFTTNSYKEADDYIKILNKISKHEKNKIIADGVPSTSNPTYNTNVQTISTLLNDNVKQASNQMSEQELTTSKVGCQAETKVGDSPPKTKRYFTRRTNKMSFNTVSIDQTVENDTPETSKCGEEIVKYSQKDDSPAGNSQEITDKLILLETLRKVLGDNYKEKVGMIYNDFKTRYRMLKILCYDSLHQCKSWKALMDEILDDGGNGQKVVSRQEKKVTWSNMQNNDDDMDEADKDNNNRANNNVE